MISCLQCGKQPAAASFALCVECLRQYPDKEKLVAMGSEGRRIVEEQLNENVLLEKITHVYDTVFQNKK